MPVKPDGFLGKGDYDPVRSKGLIRVVLDACRTYLIQGLIPNFLMDWAILQEIRKNGKSTHLTLIFR